MNWPKLLKRTALQTLFAFVFVSLINAGIDGGFQRWGHNIRSAVLLFLGLLIINYWQAKKESV